MALLLKSSNALLFLFIFVWSSYTTRSWKQRETVPKTQLFPTAFYGSFHAQMSVVKLNPVTTDRNSAMSQSELKSNYMQSETSAGKRASKSRLVLVLLLNYWLVGLLKTLVYLKTCCWSATFTLLSPLNMMAAFQSRLAECWD